MRNKLTPYQYTMLFRQDLLYEIVLPAIQFQPSITTFNRITRWRYHLECSSSFFSIIELGKFTRETDSRLVDSDLSSAESYRHLLLVLPTIEKTNFEYLRIRAHRRTVRTVNHHTKKDLSIFAYRDSRERVRICRRGGFDVVVTMSNCRDTKYIQPNLPETKYTTGIFYANKK